MTFQVNKVMMNKKNSLHKLYHNTAEGNLLIKTVHLNVGRLKCISLPVLQWTIELIIIKISLFSNNTMLRH
jgi:hypothetical protein